jgi:hypothetical protein
LIRAHRKAAHQRRTPKRGRKFGTHFTLGVLECAGAPALSCLHRITLPVSILTARRGHRPLVRNLFARQSRFHLIKLPKTIALHAYATNIQN